MHSTSVSHLIQQSLILFLRCLESTRRFHNRYRFKFRSGQLKEKLGPVHKSGTSVGKASVGVHPADPEASICRPFSGPLHRTRDKWRQLRPQPHLLCLLGPLSLTCLGCQALWPLASNCLLALQLSFVYPLANWSRTTVTQVHEGLPLYILIGHHVAAMSFEPQDSCWWAHYSPSCPSCGKVKGQMGSETSFPCLTPAFVF